MIDPFYGCADSVAGLARALCDRASDATGLPVVPRGIYIARAET